MRHICICILGYSGTGKDEIAKRLILAHGAVQTGLADPAKRHMADLYGFTEHQLFGPSEARNSGDLRYPKDPLVAGGFKPSSVSSDNPPPHVTGTLERGVRYWESDGRGKYGNLSPRLGDGGLPYVPLRLGNGRAYVPEGDPRFWLSPREALQRYCELMNQMYLRSWSRKGIEIHRKLAEIHQMDGSEAFFRHSYSRMEGVIPNDLEDGSNWRPYDGTFVTCFADFRHKHEIEEANRAKEDGGIVPVLVRVRRPSVPEPPYDHRSETEQKDIPDAAFDYLLDNDGTLGEIHAKVDKLIKEVKDPGWEALRTVRRVTES